MLIDLRYDLGNNPSRRDTDSLPTPILSELTIEMQDYVIEYVIEKIGEFYE